MADHRILTVRQPWAWALTVRPQSVFASPKNIENRASPWARGTYTGWVWFHAASERDRRLSGFIAISSPLGASLAAHWLGGSEKPDRVGHWAAAALRDLVLSTTGPAIRPLGVQRAIIGGANLVSRHLATEACVAPDGSCWPWGELDVAWGVDGKAAAPGQGCCHLVFEDPVQVWPPIDCDGHLGLWSPAPDLGSALTSALQAIEQGENT